MSTQVDAEDRMHLSRSTAELLHESQRIGVQFLLADLAMALTFLDVSEGTELAESRVRNRQNARNVYETVIRLMSKVNPSSEERAILEDRLAQLERRLIAVGLLFDRDDKDLRLPENRI